MNRLAKWIVPIAAALVLVFGGVPTASTAVVPSDVSDFSFVSFDGQYYLDTDAEGFATTRVVETIVARFPDFDQNRGIIRALPLRDGEVPLDVTMLTVTDENGNPVYFERNDYDGFAEFALGTDDFVHGVTTYVLEYTMRNTVRHFEDSGGDEFYWDVNGTGWAQTFDSVSATVFLSETLAASTTGASACYLGYYGETGACELTANVENTLFEASVGPVGSYNTLTIAIGFEGATVTQPPLPRESWIVQIAPKLLLALSGVVLLIAVVIRKVIWRDARGRGTIIAQFEPPDGSHLLLDAEILDRTGPAFAAQFVDFAVRGMIHVIDEAPESPVTNANDRFAIEFVSTDTASARELAILNNLFDDELEPGTRVNPGSLSASVGASLYAMTASTAALAVAEGFRAQPASRAPKVLGRIGFWLVLAFIPIWIWASVFDVLGANVLVPAFAVIALSIVIPVVLIRPKLLTRKGAEAKEYLEGVREYLTIAEEDRLRVLQSPEGALRVKATDHDAVVKLNERLLAYAVLWGVEDRWADVLKAQYASGSPGWFSGSTFDGDTLRRFSVASRASVAPVVSSSSSGSSWSSSGGSSFSSGSSGGGFSGGGGGGGGGGGR